MAKSPASPRSTAKAAPKAARASHHHDESPPASASNDVVAMDYPAHEAMYARFGEVVKWGIIGAVILVLFLYVVIHPMVVSAPS